MKIKENTIALPVPTTELLAEKERKWRLTLPSDYRDFIIKYNGGEPVECEFKCNNRNYLITRFLCILKNVKESESGWYDIGVVESQIGERSMSST